MNWELKIFKDKILKEYLLQKINIKFKCKRNQKVLVKKCKKQIFELKKKGHILVLIKGKKINKKRKI